MRHTILIFAFVVSGFLAGPAIAQQADELARIESLRLAGRLTEAQAAAEARLDVVTETTQQVELHLELARIHDRFGLHHNTRPVAAARRHIEAAERTAEPGHIRSQARLALAWADYHYRAEMAERVFEHAARFAGNAITLFADLGDYHGQADAVHRLGLVELQRRNLSRAHELFEESLQLDRQGGERVFFRGEYERHVGFVFMLRGELSATIPYFERSLAARRAVGAIDASLFAAESLASSLVQTGQLQAAKPHLLYAMLIGEKIGSPVGLARTGLTLGRLHAQEGDADAARIAFEMALDKARETNSASIAQRAITALEALTATASDEI